MTAILAARIPGAVIIGADRAWHDPDSDKRGDHAGKVLRMGDWYIGLAGNVPFEWDRLSRCKPATLAAVGEILGPCPEGEAVLVRGRSIYLGQSIRGGWEWVRQRGDAAIGSGGIPLSAAWDALKTYEPDPRKRMRRALKATARHVLSVAGPFDVRVV